ncbi:MAG TPA: class I SAM-dependent rRNA methyltransferase [Patescibacteria group bacterium]|nr:class I SAM-dependent rRNA methyltransferase [Patescibacteria group bacterium]
MPTAETSGSVYLKAGRDRRVRAGHLWIYRGEIGRTTGDCVPGTVVDVLDPRGRFLGRGHFNPASQITVRLLTRRREEAVDAALIRRRIAGAVAYRRRFYEAGDTCRLIFSEGDWLPGLVVDRYGTWLAVQLGTLGMDRMREAVVAALQDAVHPRGIYERSDLPSRVHEGLSPVTGLLAGEVPDEITVTVDGVQLVVSLKEGQKTGLFLDHRDTRRVVRAHAAGRRVLDVFCNAGSFALHALAGGAREAVGIESAPEALAAARRNAAINGRADSLRLIEGNAFDRLRELEKAGERFDLVVLDPPAFTKNAQSVAAARRGYKEINLRALRLATPGGMVMTASCSYHLGPEEFLDVLREAAADAGRPVTLVALGGQSPDHPIHLGVPETRYLKTALLAVRD